MRSGDLPRMFLVRFILIVLHVNFINASKLNFYQDVEPERPLDTNYEQIARYLESQKESNIRENINRRRISPNLPWPYDEYLDYRRQNEKKILESLLENPRILDVLENRKLSKEQNEIEEELPPHYEIREDLTRGINEPEEFRPFINGDPPLSSFDDYTNVNIPYAKNIFRNENPYYAAPQASNFPLRSNQPENNENNPIDDIITERLMKLEGKLMEINEERNFFDENKSSGIKEPQFTFKFDPPNINEPYKFAIKPNDPRYYEELTSTESIIVNEQQTTQNHEIIIEKYQEIVKDNFVNEEKAKTDIERVTENIRNDKFSIMKIVMPEPQRRSDHDSVIVSPSHMMSNDIYFIAIVAGCSAAAMFALVLITLTWCRLQRGAKAAADIEYPAYGVTGPNKDISPSGDQRLAHSAQMYHFQHQKQQIIAMENRTAASRDPASVSEAESDEENEEGDYTVYECPGLASTGEMEVKNPLFHDDPTPATPPQIHKDEDHM